MARPARSSRTRTRSVRRPISSRPGSVVTPMPGATGEAAAPTTPPAAAPVPRAVNRVAAPAASRGIITDYGYVIDELKRIFVLSAGILIFLFVLYFIIG